MSLKRNRERHAREVEACEKQSGASRETIQQALANYPRTAEALRVAGTKLVEHGFTVEQVGVIMNVMEPVLNACCDDNDNRLDLVSSMLGRIRRTLEGNGKTP